MKSNCPECNSENKHYPINTDNYGNPTDGAYASYCPTCDWEEEHDDER